MQAKPEPGVQRSNLVDSKRKHSPVRIVDTVPRRPEKIPPEVRTCTVGHSPYKLGSRSPYALCCGHDAPLADCLEGARRVVPAAVSQCLCSVATGQVCVTHRSRSDEDAETKSLVHRKPSHAVILELKPPSAAIPAFGQAQISMHLYQLGPMQRRCHAHLAKMPLRALWLGWPWSVSENPKDMVQQSDEWP